MGSGPKSCGGSCGYLSDDAACAGPSLTCAPKGRKDESRLEGAVNDDDEA